MNRLHDIEHRLLVLIQEAGLIVIAISTVIAVGFELASMVAARTITLADLLLLFIYMEVLAMVAVYIDCGKLPVRMPIYIGIISLARYLILDMKSLDSLRMLSIAGATLLLALAILVIRYGHVRFPYNSADDCSEHGDGRRCDYDEKE